MSKRYASQLCCFLLILACIGLHFPAFAAGHNNLSARIAAARRQGTTFREVRLFANVSGVKHTAVLERETLLQPVAAGIAGVFAERPYALSFSLRSDEGATYTLELLQSQPVSDQLNTGTIDKDGRHAAAYVPGLHYQGHVAGADNSLAAMSIFANGDVMILFANDEGNFVIGKVEDGSGNYTFYNDKAMRYKPEMPCGVMDAGGKPLTPAAAKGATALMCNKVRVYWEVSYNLYTSKGSNLTTMQNYVTGLFNQFQALYANDNIAVELKSFYIWRAQDDYPTASSSVALNKFRGYWNTMDDSFDGDIAHLLTRDNNGNGGGNGGLAYVDVLCSRNYGYAYSDIYGTFQTIPTYSWDAMVVSHETGHNMGSKHTHWCGWNTGANGTCGSIDNCTTQEADGGCTTCPSTYSNSAATTAWRGTIMSYCHLVARGISLANGFGPLPGALIRGKVTTQSCLVPMINATLTPAASCAGNDGTVTLSYPSNNFGAAPYVYAWTQGSATKDISGLAPGTYSVNITDSNGCTADFSTTVAAAPFAGNATALTEDMPVCCQNTSRQLTLRASAPRGLHTGCETVYWLRTPAPVSNMAALKNIFDTTQPANILVSSNSGSINATTGAQLKVSPPATCTGPVTYYYTPVAVRLPRNTDSVFSLVSSSVPYMNGSVQLGNSLVLPDLRSAVPACLLDDTAVQQQFTIYVTGYTGRPGNMRIVVQDASGSTLLQEFGLSGVGTYVLDPASFKASILQGMTVTVLDFNCTTGTASTCTSSQATLSAVRRAVYAPAVLRLSPACTVSAPVRIDFSPDHCTNLAVAGAAQLADQPSLYPNPASQSAMLKYQTSNAGKVSIRVTDVAGRVIWQQEQTKAAGRYEQLLDVHGWARGLYFVRLGNGTQQAAALKLTVE